MSRTYRAHTAALLAGATTLAATLLASTLAAVPSAGGQGAAEDYPEYPYPQTNYQENNRGQFHFSSRGGWMNDVNAPLYYDGTYHLYYQHNPHGLEWDTMHWGHATSTDLVHWKQKPIALEPGVHPGDLFSGGGVVDERNVSGLKDGAEDPIVVYSGTNGVTVFYSTDGGNTFSTYDGGNPVAKPDGTSRDPQVSWDPASKQWVMVVWSDGGGNGVDLYTSDNLLDWTFASRYAADWLFECPELLRMPVDGNASRSKWLLHDGSGEYVVGDFDGQRFSTDDPEPQWINTGEGGAGSDYYASLAFQNLPDKRTVSMAWQGRNEGSVWTGNATFPVQMRLRDVGGRLTVYSTPVRELDVLRGKRRTWGPRTLSPQAAGRLLDGVRADTYELKATVDVRRTKASSVGFGLHTGPNGETDREVVYDLDRRTLDGDRLSPVNGKVTVRMLVDRGQLELFGNDGALYKSENVNFDSLPGGNGLDLVADGAVRLESLRIDKLRSAWGGEAMLESNLSGSWYADSGRWSDAAAGKRAESGGDGFYLNTANGEDFTMEADVRLDDSVAGGITFRANRDASEHYTLTLDADAGVVKLWRPGRDLATAPLAIERGRTYTVKVVAEGDRIRGYVDGATEPLIDVTDATYESGRFGLNVYHGSATYQDVRVDPIG